jgi:hypothetical protein
MSDLQRELRERWGLWLVLVALVLGLVSSLTYFPVWSADGSSMLALIGFIPNSPLLFVLERVGPVGAIVWVVGAALIESGRLDPTSLNGRWNRERLAIVSALGAVAVFLGTFGSFAYPWTALDLVRAVMGIVVSVAVGLYLLWTGERALGVFAKRLGLIALSLGLVAAALSFVSFGPLYGTLELSLRFSRPASITGAVLGAGSLTIWILTFSLVLRRVKNVILAVPPSAGA